MKTSEIIFFSCKQLSDILNSFLGKIHIVQLEDGPLKGSIKIMYLQNLVILIFASNCRLAVMGMKDIAKFHVFLELNNDRTDLYECLKSNDVNISSESLFGYSYSIKNHDLELKKNCRICYLAGNRDLLANLNHLKENSIIMDNLYESNARQTLKDDKLRILFDEKNISELLRNPEEYEKIILKQLVISFSSKCLIQAPPIKMSNRGYMAYKLVCTYMENEIYHLTVAHLANVLHYSRTSLTKACEEKFGFGTLKLIKSIKLDMCRHALTNQHIIHSLRLSTVAEIAKYYGFQSRSNFASAYKARFKELPRDNRKNYKKIAI